VDAAADQDEPQDELVEALYTAVGFAVLGFQRLMYAGRQVGVDAKDRLDGASVETRAQVASIADDVDAGLKRLSDAPSQPVAEVAAIALSTARHLREQVLDPWVERPPH